MRTAKTPRICRLKVTLRGIRPPIWRRFEVDSNITFAELHEVLQIVLGWLNCHLHEFEIGPERIGMIDPDWGDDGVRDERRVKLSKFARKGTRMLYKYDFGDGWMHDIVIEDVHAPEAGTSYPVCLKGKRGCPPEDCGGPYGYKNLLDALADPSHRDREHYSDWIGPYFAPEKFDLDVTNKLLEPLQPKPAHRKNSAKDPAVKRHGGPQLRLVK